ncbi:MAG: hypothetical protein GX962_01135 [Epulopiscium sp.]|nr:hypothetical protein [Candidatus Epulonipiscium sp.]
MFVIPGSGTFGSTVVAFTALASLTSTLVSSRTVTVMLPVVNSSGISNSNSSSS